jgi:hypothetical protein
VGAATNACRSGGTDLSDLDREKGLRPFMGKSHSIDMVSQQPAQSAFEELRTPMRRASLVLLVLTVVAGIYVSSFAVIGSYVPYFPTQFLLSQDILVALLFALFWALFAKIKSPALNLDRFVSPLAFTASRTATLLAVLAMMVCAAGVRLVFGGYGLVMDEHWARFDAIVIGRGAGMARIPEEWRGYAAAMHPQFARITPDGWWASEYLPVNAALQYLGGTLASPLLAGWAVLVASDLARRLLPGAPAAPLVCALLMVTSSQLLITGMTPFAMSAHLAFNLSWLWLFLHGDWRLKIAALPVAVLAIGLHQVVFFPLFAASFLLEAWLTGQRRAVLVQGVAIAAGFVFWSAYDTVLYTALGTQPDATTIGGTGTGTALLFTRFLTLVENFTLVSIGKMAINLIRFVTWQGVLIVPLVLIATPAVVRTLGPWRAMLSSILLTIVAMTVLLADQHHGWGYRYLHGHLGSLCLLATLGWYRLPSAVRVSGAAQGMFCAGLALSLLLLPLRVWQAGSYVEPYARADVAISAIDADVVLVDTPQHLFAFDLARNDPLLRNRPKRMVAAALSDAQLARLCQEYTVARFTDADAARFGMHEVETGMPVRGVPQECSGGDQAPD